MAEEKKVQVKKETKSVAKAALKKTSGKGFKLLRLFQGLKSNINKKLFLL